MCGIILIYFLPPDCLSRLFPFGVENCHGFFLLQCGDGFLVVGVGCWLVLVVMAANFLPAWFHPPDMTCQASFHPGVKTAS